MGSKFGALLGDFVEAVFAAGGEDEVGAVGSEEEGGGSADAGGGSGDEGDLVVEFAGAHGLGWMVALSPKGDVAGRGGAVLLQMRGGFGGGGRDAGGVLHETNSPFGIWISDRSGVRKRQTER